MPIRRLKRVFGISPRVRLTRTKVIQKILQKYGKEGNYGKKGDLDQYNWGKLLKLAGIRPYKGLTKEKLIKIVREGE